jgi:glycosyltransferase involved in cell wall biosynthesis
MVDIAKNTVHGRVARRILLQADSFTQGGMETMMIDLGASLMKRGFEVSLLIVGQAGPSVSSARSVGIHVIEGHGGMTPNEYRHLLISCSIDLVNAHFSVFGARVASGAGIPFVQTIHNLYVWLGDQEIKAYKKADRYTSAYVCVSPHVAMYSDSVLGLTPSKMQVIPNGFDPALFQHVDPVAARSELRRSWHAGDQDTVFLNVGTICLTKAQLPLIEAFVEVTRNHPNCKLILLGRSADAGYEEELRNCIVAHRLESQVFFEGHREYIGSYYHAADVFVLPSYLEGCSLALAEAFYSGIPIVATAVGSARDLESIENVSLVEPAYGDVRRLTAEAFSRLVWTLDTAFIARLSAAMRQSIYQKRMNHSSDRLRLLEKEYAYAQCAQLFGALLDR